MHLVLDLYEKKNHKITECFFKFSEVIFKIDSSERYQEHVGIGGAFTDSMGLLFNRLSPGTQDNLMK